jgi:hypothetical protein
MSLSLTLDFKEAVTMNLVKYRLHSSSFALFPIDGHHVVRTVPAGSEVTIDEDLFDETKPVVVQWHGNKVMMFPRDVRTRGEKIG